MKHGFTYNEKSTEDFGVIVASFEGLDEIDSGLQRTILKGESTEYRYIPNHFGVQYSGVIEFTGALIKPDGTSFTEAEIRSISKWLTSSKLPSYLEYKGSNENTYLYKGLFTDIRYKHAVQGIVGIIFTFTNDSPFLYSMENNSYTISATDTIINYNCGSDLLEAYCYPTIDITYTGTENYANISITNITDNQNIFTLKCLSNAKMTIDCNHQIITTANGTFAYEDYGLDDDTYIYWPRLLSGTNQLKISCDADGDIIINIRCITPKKAGDLFEY